MSRKQLASEFKEKNQRKWTKEKKDRYEVRDVDRDQGDSGALVRLTKDRTKYTSHSVKNNEIMEPKL